MGDDRRGGHTWKFVSTGRLPRVDDARNSALLEDGTLYVARYNPDGTGVWIPLRLTTPTNPLEAVGDRLRRAGRAGQRPAERSAEAPEAGRHRRPVGERWSVQLRSDERSHGAARLSGQDPRRLLREPGRGAGRRVPGRQPGGRYPVRAARGHRAQSPEQARGHHRHDRRRARQRRLSGLTGLRGGQVQHRRRRHPAVGLAAQDHRGQRRRRRAHLPVGALRAGEARREPRTARASATWTISSSTTRPNCGG